MGILLPNDVDWSPANWVGRALFTDLLEQSDLPAHLADELRFCVDAELDTLDLRAAATADIAVLRTLVEVVLDHASAITSKPASRDHVKTGHFGRAGTDVIYCATAALGKFAA